MQSFHGRATVSTSDEHCGTVASGPRGVLRVPLRWAARRGQDACVAGPAVVLRERERAVLEGPGGSRTHRGLDQQRPDRTAACEGVAPGAHLALRQEQDRDVGHEETSCLFEEFEPELQRDTQTGRPVALAWCPQELANVGPGGERCVSFGRVPVPCRALGSTLASTGLPKCDPGREKGTTTSNGRPLC